MKGISGGMLLDEQGRVIGLNAFRRNDLAGEPYPYPLAASAALAPASRFCTATCACAARG